MSAAVAVHADGLDERVANVEWSLVGAGLDAARCSDIATAAASAVDLGPLLQALPGGDAA